MKVKDLITKLQRLNNPEAIIYLQRGPEGNGYSLLSGIDENNVCVKGDIYDLDWTADQADKSDVEWNKIKNMKKCVVLYPKYEDKLDEKRK